MSDPNPTPGFCDECRVSLDLHDGEGSFYCKAAEAKADLIDRFYRPFVRGADV